MSDKPLVRPPRVRSAGIFLVVVLGVTLVSVLQRLWSWQSLDQQKTVRATAEDLLTSAGSPSSVSVSDVVDVLHTVAMGELLLAGVGMVLAVYVLRGDLAARALAPPLAVVVGLAETSSSVVGVVLIVYGALAAFWLWSAESTAWFDAVNGRPRRVVAVHPAVMAPRLPTQQTRPQPGTQQTRPQQTQPPPYGPPPPTATWQAPPTGWQPPPQAPVYGPPPPAGYLGGVPTRRPTPLVVAAVIVLAGAALVALVAGINALAYAVSPSHYVEMMRDSPQIEKAVAETSLDMADFARELFAACLVLLAVALVWAVVGLLLLAVRHPFSYWLAYVLSIGTAIVAAVVSWFAFLVGVPLVAAAVGLVVVLRQQDVKAWFVRT